MGRTGLSRAEVIDTAAQIVDEDGLAGLTMAALAKRLGIALPSLYTHVRSLDHLRQEVALAVTEALSLAMDDAIRGRAGADALAALANAYRAYAVRHAGRYAASMVVRLDAADPRTQAAIGHCADVVYGTLRGYRLEEPALTSAARFLRAALHGFASIEGQDGFGHPASVDASFADFVAGVHRALESWPQPKRRRR
jgi:AcrR family transcriptional regulator